MTILSHRKTVQAITGLLLALLLPVPLAAAGRQEAASSADDAGESAFQARPGELVEKIACASDPTQTYTLYLPSGYTTNRRWPVLFVFDPRGRSVLAAEIFRAAAERYGWILMSSDNTRSDGPWDPNFKAVAAMGPDVSRYAFDADRIYATGFSGGAMLAWIWGQQTHGLAGVIGSGGRPVKPASAETEVPFAFFGAAGEEEFNYEPTRELDNTAARLGAPHRFESFPGPHAWMPAELALEAVEWMEIQAMSSGKRPKDPGLIAELYEKDLDRARQLEDEGEALKAQRRYDAIARTFEGLLDVEEVAGRAAALAKSPEVKKAKSAEDSARRYQRARLLQIGNALSRFKAPTDTAGQPTIMDTGRLEAELRLPGLLKTAQEETAKGLAARRALNSLSSQLGFYLPREFFQIRDYERAAVVLQLATRIGPPRPFVLYNLAAAQARSGRRKRAISALTDAVDAGFSNLDYMEQDSDLESLRKLPGYADLLTRMREAG
jgi:dienelactone hydrolase